MKHVIYICMLSATLAALHACGGGGSGGGSGTGGPSTKLITTGVMAEGSVVLNGVKFDDSTATILIDDTPKTAADLKDGMVVQLLGLVSADDTPTTGIASRVESQIEVRGPVTTTHPAENPQRFVVLGQNVIVDELTVYSGLADFAAITPTTLLEVYGFRDTAKRIRATRVEADVAQMGDSTTDAIRGVVSAGVGTNPSTFNLGGQAINAAGAVIAPMDATYANGSVVEVNCNARPCVNATVFQASSIEVELAEDSAFQPAFNGRMESGGLITGFAAVPGNFLVAGIPVATNGSTRFKGGTSDDLGNDVNIETEGNWKGSSQLASRIVFSQPIIRLQGLTANRDTANQTFNLRIANNSYVVKIERNSLTTGALLPANLACAQVRGRRKIGAATLTVIATDIKTTCLVGDPHFIRAPVESEIPEVFITLLGFALNVNFPSGPTNQWENVNSQSISRTAFFDLVTPPTVNVAGVASPGTLVKVLFDDGTNTVNQAKIED